MGYTIVTIRSAEEDDGRLYPVIGDDDSPVEIEEWDEEIQRLTGSSLKVSELVAGGWKTVGQFKDVKVDVLITGSRVVVACEKFDKGGGWVGFGGAGVAFSLAANGVSKIRAANRRRGKMLVGQVRHSWLRCVGFSPKTGWASEEEVRLGAVVKLQDGSTRELFLDISLPKNVNSREVARTIVQRAARYRLDHTKIDSDEERDRYDQLASAEPLPASDPKKFTLYQMPTYFFVGIASAYPLAEGIPSEVEA